MLDLTFKTWLEATVDTPMSSLYWISPKGELIPGGPFSIHIQHILKDPEKFNTTTSNIQAIHDKHGETVGSEGYARTEIMDKAIRNGWIRVRNGYGRSNGIWRIETAILDPKTISNINEFVWMLAASKSHKYDQLNIQTLQGQLIDSDVEEWIKKHGF